ncbi:hypothetical protein CNE_1c13860 [Cupriavidus necator N-1]|jgi:hypothetical protein|uniref:Uncharacterized protein n=1 Tax=Cupriavidus necator (strain ATCC 43291 / DSM 13513 / CCUG 52238 / LMG 8453 / N-1) TaxID=1042878 RepID=G0EST8_CUPNN|nr:hypothetical protein CNE_1c13860 [Cupriavidus necator N-1]
MRFNRESGRRGIGENPRIKKAAAMPTARRSRAAEMKKAGSNASGFS